VTESEDFYQNVDEKVAKLDDNPEDLLDDGE
jgi:hypothetical protein